MTENRPADDLPYFLLNGMAHEYENAPASRTNAAKMADALDHADDLGFVMLKKGTFSPDPLPSREIPRDQWPNIRPGTRVHVERNDESVWIGPVTQHYLDGFYVGARNSNFRYIDRVFVLDEPADPDADLIERIAKAIAKSDDEDNPEEWGSLYSDRARAALAVVRESEAGA